LGAPLGHDFIAVDPEMHHAVLLRADGFRVAWGADGDSPDGPDVSEWWLPGTNEGAWTKVGMSAAREVFLWEILLAARSKNNGWQRQPKVNERSGFVRSRL